MAAPDDTCNALWLGPSFGPIERACLRSVVRHGHRLLLWCYDVPQGVPAGLELRDASEILPRSRIKGLERGGHALFANLFRYALLQRGLGLWVDCDLYLLAPLTGLPDHVFGWQDSQSINTAVLRLPATSPLLPQLIDIFEEREVPPWLSFPDRAAAWLRLKREGRAGLALMPWGSAGPHAFTWLAREAGLDRLALPAPIFYPAPWQRAGWVRDPAIAPEDVVTPETRAIHLWNEKIRTFKDAPAAPGSFLARLQVEGARD